MSASAATAAESGAAEVSRQIAAFSRVTFTHGLRAIVLTGSLARAEGTWTRQGERIQLAGDAEFLLVFDDDSTLPSQSQAATAAASVESSLRSLGIDVAIGLSPVGKKYLRDLQPHIFAFELAEHGKVIWGDPRILDLAPSFSCNRIPVEDGFRILSNRIVELLEALADADGDAAASENVQYRAVKLTLDMATSFLLFQGKYVSSYRARARRLSALIEDKPETPVELLRLAKRVEVSTQIKLGGDSPESRPRLDLAELIDDARWLWRWQLRKLTGADEGINDRDLIRQWLSGQSILARLRGWASVAKRCGASSSMRHLPEWAGLMSKGTPRALIYAAASELFFSLADMFRYRGLPSAEQAHWRRLLGQLPVNASHPHQSGRTQWRSVGLAIAWNYHEFLEFTRS